MTLPAVALADTKQTLDIRPHEAPAICGAQAPQLEVEVSGVEAKGILTVELYTPSKRDFLRKASRLKRIRVPAENGSQTVCFDLPAAGTYALAAYHDVDADRDLARQWNMMPAEPFAISSKKPLRLGVPRFEEAAFAAGEKTTWIRLELKK
ncbi:MAG: DUF2141 domain-containing protein [Hyphomonas sp.]